MKKILIASLFLFLLVSHPVPVRALDEIEENNLELKVERIESDGEDKKVTNQKNNEQLFNEQNIKKLAEAKQKADQEVLETKESLFKQKAIKLKAHDKNDVFQAEAKMYYMGDAQDKLKESKDTKMNVPSLLVGLGIVIIGTTGVYFYMKKR